MEELFFSIEMPLIYSLFHMEQAGICVKREELQAYGERLRGQIETLEQEIYQGTGEVFNINSPKQLGEILFGKMELPYGKKTKTGYSTAADVLEKLAPEYPVVQKILDYRPADKAEIHLRRRTGRLHPGRRQNPRNFQSDSNGDRKAEQYGAQPSEYSREDGAGTGDTPGLCAPGGLRFCGRRLLPD